MRGGICSVLASTLVGCSATTAGTTTSGTTSDGGRADGAPSGQYDATVATDAGGAVSSSDATGPASDDAQTASDVAVADDLGVVEVGGPCPAPAGSPSPPVCGTLCGNGVRDTCSGGFNGSNQTEACDGADLGGSTCASLGFTGGTLACSTTCEFDTRGCDACAHGSPNVLGCIRPDVDDAFGRLALAASDQEIILAWTAVAANDGTGSVRFARFRGDLSLIYASGCIGPTNASQVSLAASPSGWILAIGTGQPRSLQLLPLSPIGEVRGPVRTIVGPTTTEYVPYVSPLLVPRKLEGGPVLGGPLLVWTAPVPPKNPGASPVQETRMAVLLRDDATDETTPVALPDTSEMDSFSTSGVFVGDGFLYSQSEYAYPQSANVWHVGLDGQLGPAINPISPSRQAVGPGLAWTGTEGRFTYDDFDPRGVEAGVASFIRLDGDGGPLGAPMSLDTHESVISPVALGDDLLVLIGWTKSMSALRVSKKGSIVVPAYPVAVGGFSEQHVTLRGPDVIAAWLRNAPSGSLGLARLAP